MTIIAYRDGIMAGDSWVSSTSGRFCGNVVKIQKNKFGMLLGASGGSAEAYEFHEWFADQDPTTWRKMPEGLRTHALIVLPNNEVWDVEEGRVLPCPDISEFGFTAVGSGVSYAMAAMAMRATAEQAVEVAIKLSMDCGGEVHSVRLDSVEAA